MAKYLKKEKKNKTGLILLLIFLLLMIAAAITVIIIEWNKWFPKSDFDPSAFHASETLATGSEISIPTVSGSEEVPESTEPGPPDNPVKFADLQAINSDVYAWIYVPDTCVDYPVFQSTGKEDDNLYLHHNIYKEYEYQGAVYTQKANAKDFTDRVTIIYGHNMLNDSMFSTLDEFYDKTFFEEHPNFFIYTPGHILTYQIVSVHQYDKRHILNSFDFSKDEVFQDWLDMIRNPKAFFAHVRDGIELDLNSRIVTLSTCMNHGTARFLIEGVLISDEPTK